MKKLIASLTILATGAALASSVNSEQTFGVLKITSSAKETAISVPWISAGTSGETIKVKDFVKTSNLSKDDLLMVYDPSSSSFKCWVLSAKGGTWEATGTSYNGVNIPAGSAGDTLQRGQALILVRNDTSDSNIYLYGQYRDKSDVSYVIPRVAGQTTLFAPINVSGSNLNLNSLTWDGVQPKDRIRLQRSDDTVVTLTYKDSTDKWGYQSKSGWYTGDSVLKAGQGAWYTTVSGEGTDVDVSGL